MIRTVWVDGWQMQCCGDPMHVGETVSWRLSRDVDRDFLGQVLGAAEASLLTDAEDHHETLSTNTELTVGTIRSIRASFCDFAPRAGSGQTTRYPVVGSGTVEGRASADGWEPEGDDRRFVGYVVAVEVIGSERHE